MSAGKKGIMKTKQSAEGRDPEERHSTVAAVTRGACGRRGDWGRTLASPQKKREMPEGKKDGAHKQKHAEGCYPAPEALSGKRKADASACLKKKKRGEKETTYSLSAGR